jgi:alpha-tubulin suppressor-like RCC1 family protein
MFVLCRDGRVLAVGKNASGELGDGTTTNRKVPIVVTGLTAVTGLAVGAAHSVAATGATASSWGQNRYGQLGIGNTVGQKTPVAIGGVGGLMPIDS